MDYLRELQTKAWDCQEGQSLDTWITSWCLLTEKLDAFAFLTWGEVLMVLVAPGGCAALMAIG